MADVFTDKDFKTLHAAVERATPGDSATTAKTLMGAKHPAGIIFLAGKTIPHLSTHRGSTDGPLVLPRSCGGASQHTQVRQQVTRRVCGAHHRSEEDNYLIIYIIISMEAACQ